MADEKLRELERRWQVTGSPIDEACFLLERVRAGALEQRLLGLAAYLGHRGARDALGSLAPPAPPGSAQAGEGRQDALLEWLAGLQSYGREPLVRLGLARAREALTDRRLDGGRELQDWLDCPCEDHRRVAVALLDAAEAIQEEYEYAAATSRGLSTDTILARRYRQPTATIRLLACEEHRLASCARELCAALLESPWLDFDGPYGPDTVRRELLAWALGPGSGQGEVGPPSHAT